MARKKALPALHELESEVMEAVWAHDEVSVRQVMEMLNAKASKPRAYTTYMTIMRRLDDKGLLERRREGKTDFYRPAYAREEYAQLRAQAEGNALVDRYGDVALGHFARQIEQLDPAQRRALQRLARRGWRRDSESAPAASPNGMAARTSTHGWLDSRGGLSDVVMSALRPSCQASSATAASEKTAQARSADGSRHAGRAPSRWSTRSGEIPTTAASAVSPNWSMAAASG